MVMCLLVSVVRVTLSDWYDTATTLGKRAGQPHASDFALSPLSRYNWRN